MRQFRQQAAVFGAAEVWYGRSALGGTAAHDSPSRRARRIPAGARRPGARPGAESGRRPAAAARGVSRRGVACGGRRPVRPGEQAGAGSFGSRPRREPLPALARTEASVSRRLQAARQTMAAAQRDLGDQLRYLYEQGDPDAIAVVLGATSLENAVNSLDAVHRARRATQEVLDRARSARTDLVSLRGSWRFRCPARPRRGRVLRTPPPGSSGPMPSAPPTSPAYGTSRT